MRNVNSYYDINLDFTNYIIMSNAYYCDTDEYS